MSAAENPHAGQGAVMLDIGGDVGALVVTTPASMAGVEVEIVPTGTAGRHGHPPHVAVVPRPVGDVLVHSLVFPDVTEGTYDLYVRPDGPVALTATVRGAQVTECAWPS